MIFGKRYEELKEKIAELKDATKDVLKKEEVVECETCGCLVYAKSARNGKPEVRQKSTIERLWLHSFFGDLIGESEQYIYTPQYCKRCYPLKDTIKMVNPPPIAASKPKKRGSQ